MLRPASRSVGGVTERRIAHIAHTSIYVGPDIARLGTLAECAAFAMAFVDATTTFTTGQVVNYAGGWA